MDINNLRLPNLPNRGGTGSNNWWSAPPPAPLRRYFILLKNHVYLAYQVGALTNIWLRKF